MSSFAADFIYLKTNSLLVYSKSLKWKFFSSLKYSQCLIQVLLKKNKFNISTVSWRIQDAIYWIVVGFITLQSTFLKTWITWVTKCFKQKVITRTPLSSKFLADRRPKSFSSCLMNSIWNKVCRNSISKQLPFNNDTAQPDRRKPVIYKPRLNVECKALSINKCPSVTIITNPSGPTSSVQVVCNCWLRNSCWCICRWYSTRHQLTNSSVQQINSWHCKKIIHNETEANISCVIIIPNEKLRVKKHDSQKGQHWFLVTVFSTQKSPRVTSIPCDINGAGNKIHPIPIPLQNLQNILGLYR